MAHLFGVCSCRPVLHRSCAAGRAPDCGTLTVKLIGFDFRQYSSAFGWGVEPRGLVGWA
jgi:hypothetical protein